LDLYKKMTIHILHQIWMQGASNIPSKYIPWMNRWKQLHLSWDIRLWDETSINALIQQWFPEYWRIYKNIKQLIIRCDIARAIILYVHGGVYVDCDTKPTTNIDALIDTKTTKHVFMICKSLWPLLQYNNNVLVSSPRNPIWTERILPEMFARCAKERKTFMHTINTSLYVLYVAGPRLYDTVLEETDFERYGVIILDTHISNALSMSVNPSDEDLHNVYLQDGSLIYHCGDASWTVGLSSFIMEIVHFVRRHLELVILLLVSVCVYMVTKLFTRRSGLTSRVVFV
jgi:hypothetical protein